MKESGTFPAFCDYLIEEVRRLRQLVNNQDKVDYVLSQNKIVKSHTCHWPNCPKLVPPAMWGCHTHWYMLPKNIRDEIWRTYEIGQEITKTPSDEYLAIAEKAEEWILKNHPPQCRTKSKVQKTMFDDETDLPKPMDV